MARKYRTIAGDTWDLIAYKTLGNATLMDRMIAVNQDYCDTFIFPAGVVLEIPDGEILTSAMLPPWFTDNAEEYGGE